MNQFSDKLFSDENITIGFAQSQFAFLEQVIRLEMEGVLFFHVPSERAVFYGKDDLFGIDFAVMFPSLQSDMVEAGNCLAVGRGTACVFHLMRIMEAGVQSFGAKLGVSFPQDKNWQVILNEATKALKGLPSRDPATVAMAEASANLYSVKVAWRNEVMHPKATYTLEEAENTLRQMRIFMHSLAGII